MLFLNNIKLKILALLVPLVLTSCCNSTQNENLTLRWNDIIAQDLVVNQTYGNQSFFDRPKWEEFKKLETQNNLLIFLVDKLHSKKTTQIHDTISGFLDEGELAFYALENLVGEKFENLYKGDNKELLRILNDKNKYASPTLYMKKTIMGSKPMIDEIAITFRAMHR